MFVETVCPSILEYILVLHCFQFDAKAAFFSISVFTVALAVVRGDKGSILLEAGVYEGGYLIAFNSY